MKMPKQITFKIAGAAMIMAGLWGGCYVCLGLLPPTHWAQLPVSATAVGTCCVGFFILAELWP